MDSYSVTGQILLDSVLADESIVDAFARRDRETLAAIAIPMYESMREKYHIAQFHFHTPEITTFLRANNPGSYGGDLSASRETVKAANAQKRLIVGPEIGPSGLGYRVVTPLRTVAAGISDRWNAAVPSTRPFWRTWRHPARLKFWTAG